MSRSCGECQACCYALPVYKSDADVDSGLPMSPARSLCPHQCEKGCAIYEDRPGPCATYSCMWLLGWAAEDDRPDKLGLIFECNTALPGVCMVNVVRPGALHETRAQTRLAQVRCQVERLVVETNGEWVEIEVTS